MLILSRRSNQSIVIGGNIVVTVLETSGDQVRLGIEAPREVTVHREEVHREILEENRLAANTAAAAGGDGIDFGSLPKPR
ncbi:MAG TPA: carbon storage regulator CsrA [Microthrixaceae bacterium]|nr:carbon storage regulator CsrA [Microthrixaceae bacterium]